ncbi:MAG TPA: ATP-NAD kinase family protein [Cellvibrionaceae bacterium]
MTGIVEQSYDKTVTAPTIIRLGLIVNPCAGLGGRVALKGSDGEQVVAEARARGAEPQALARVSRALLPLIAHKQRFTLLGFAGAMGEDVATQLGLAFVCVGAPVSAETHASDTRAAALALQEAAVDLIVFAGGDGTARDIADVVGQNVPVLGVPAGVKMHSGVFAITPETAASVLLRMVAAQWTPLREAEVRDIDEAAFRQGRVRTRHYGDMRVPEAPGELQSTKNSGVVPDALAQLDVAAECMEQMDTDTLYLVGPGSTTQVLLQQMGLTATLLGVDVVQGGQLRLADASAGQIEALLASFKGKVSIIVTAIGGQGHVFGRGNQQLTPEIIRRVGRQGIQIIATAEKLRALAGRPLLLDTNDALLDRELAGLYTVITGYRERIMMPVGLAPVREGSW